MCNCDVYIQGELALMLQEDFMLMPVPQPQILTSWMGEVKRMRDHGLALNRAATQAGKDAETLRKRFLANQDVKDGMAIMLNVTPSDVEAHMEQMLNIAFDDSSNKHLPDIQAAFWRAFRAPVRLCIDWSQSTACHKIADSIIIVHC